MGTLSIPSMEKVVESCSASKKGGSDADAEATVSEASLRDWVISFYLEHNPERLGSVDALLVKYAGKENELIRQLERKYEGRPSGGARTSSSGATPTRQASNPFEDEDDELEFGLGAPRSHGEPQTDLERCSMKLQLTREALRTCFEENGRLQRAIVASSDLACGLADAKAKLDDSTHAAQQRQAELEASRREQTRLFEENTECHAENEQLRHALHEMHETNQKTRTNYCAPVDLEHLQSTPDDELDDLYARCSSALPLVSREIKRRLDTQRAHMLCVTCGTRMRTKMSESCSHMLYCHGCVPSGASICPLCDTVILANQWVHVRHV